MKNPLVYIVSVPFFLGSFFANSQLIVSSGSSPSSLVQNVLLGTGVTVSNIMYNGSPAAINQFTAANTNLGIQNGIVITTGTTFNNGKGPQGPNNQTNSGIDNGTGGSGLLSSIVNQMQTFNAATLEFDFIPYSDTVRFNYVFGSEEYPEFAPPNNSKYNDVFGFFIAGPGISGLQNIAKLPNGSIVSINNINQINNSSYHINNNDGNNPPQNSSDYYIQYDGFTTVLEAIAKVQCGKTYHLIIAIADVGDGIFDSGIFLQANSLSSKAPVTAAYTLSNQAFANRPNVLAEGCTSATVKLTRHTTDLSNSLTIPVQVSGTATQNVDYSSVPTSVTFPPGQATLEFTINAFADTLTEGEESLILSFDVTDPCGNISPIKVELAIDDVLPVSVTVQSSNVSCPGDNIQIVAVAAGGSAPYTYSWSTGATTPSISVSPTSTQIYTVTVTDNCLKKIVTASATVTVPIFTPLALSVSPNLSEICPYTPATLHAYPSGAVPPYKFVWSNAQSTNLGTDSILNVLPSTTTTYTVKVTDYCGSVKTDSILFTITSPPLVLTMGPPVEICPGDSAMISVTATGGFGNYHYVWKLTGDTLPQIWVRPSQTQSYQVSVSDDCRTFTVNSSATVTVVRPTADFIISSSTLFNNLPVTFGNTTLNGDTYHWSFGDGNTSMLVSPNNLYTSPGTYLVTLIAKDKKGCIDSITKPITILEEYYIYVPNAFTPDNSRFNNTFSVSTVGITKLTVSIFNRWGEIVYASDRLDFEWDGTFNGVKVQDGIYNWKISYTNTSAKTFEITGHVVMLQ
jgi:gliding motility-associated-like protein